MKVKDKISVINFEDKDEMKAGLEQMKRSLPTWVEYMDVIAKIRKASYDAHIKQGFTPGQALELCKSTML